jgi:ribosomal protein S27E
MSVGATERGHYLVVICLDCQRIFSIWRDRNSDKDQKNIPICKKCGRTLMSLTDPGAWSPSSLQNKFPDFEPWLFEDGSCFDEEPTDEEVAEILSIRVFCPNCKTFSLEYEITSHWD